jgi:hypothetical protein
VSSPLLCIIRNQLLTVSLSNFRIYFGEDFSIHCSAFRLDRDRNRTGTLLETYHPEHRVSLITWVRETIRAALPPP